MEGYVKLWRKSLESPVWENANLFYFWCYCLMKATYKERVGKVGYQDVPLRPGQFIFGRQVASKETGLSERVIRTCCKHLENMENVTIKATNKYSIISIVNWTKYQEEETSNVTSKRPASDQQATTDKKGKKDKNVKNNIYSVLFKKLWEVYPLHKDRLKAEMLFEKLKPSEELVETMIQAIERQKAEKKYSNGFTPEWKYLATWLRGECWTDEAKENPIKKRRIL